MREEGGRAIWEGGGGAGERDPGIEFGQVSMVCTAYSPRYSSIVILDKN